MLPGIGADWADSDSNAHGVDDARDEVAGKLGLDGIARPAVWRCASAISVAVGEGAS